MLDAGKMNKTSLYLILLIQIFKIQKYTCFIDIM